MAFAPHGALARLRFALRGRRLLIANLLRLARAMRNLEAGKRTELQRECAARLLAHLRVRLEIEGLAHLPRSPHVVVALHEGLADALCLTQLALPMRFVARAEIFEWQWIGPALAGMRHIAVEPEQGAQAYRKLLASAGETFSAGEHLLLFPQGAVLGIETAFQAGAFRLARTLRMPILPIVIAGAHRIWEHPFSPRVRYGQRVGIVVLPPIDAERVQARTPEALRLELQREMKAVALSGRLPAPRRYVPARDGFWDGFAFEIDESFAELRAEVAAHRRALRSRPAMST
jgi:1-acyl-sn-glycerol-3-phosphate acyltransferase